MTKPIGYWISSTNLSEQQAINNIEGVCGSFFQNISEEAKYTLIFEISKQLPHNSSLNSQIKQSIKGLSVTNLLNLITAVADSF